MVMYRDVTGNPEVEVKVDHLPELQDALTNLGFIRVGLLETQFADLSKSQAALTQMFEEQDDAEFVQRVLTRGQVTEIMRSRDKTTFAELEQFFDSQLIELCTILEDGAIIKTIVKPKRQPQQRDPIKELRDNFEGPLLNRFLNWLRGDQVSPWATEQNPHTGYFLELVEGLSPRELWHHHRRRVTTIALGRGANIPAHNSMSLYLAICERINEIKRFRGKIQKFGVKVAFMLLITAVAAFFLLEIRRVGLIGLFMGTDQSGLSWGLLISLYTCFLLLPLIGLAWPQRISPWIGRQLPFPRVRSLNELLRQYGSS